MKNRTVILYAATLAAVAEIAGCGPRVWIAGSTYDITDICANKHCDLSEPTIVANPSLGRVIAEGPNILGQVGTTSAILADPVDPTRTHRCRELKPEDYTNEGLSNGTVSTDVSTNLQAELILKAFDIVDSGIKTKLSSKISSVGIFRVQRFMLTEAAIQSMEACRTSNGGTLVVGAAVMTSTGTLTTDQFSALKGSVKASIEESGKQAQFTAKVDAASEKSVSTAFSGVSYALVWKYKAAR